MIMPIFFLNNCREIRNNYSSAHPSESMLDGIELNYFIHQCIKHVLSDNFQPIGFRIDDFMKTIKAKELDEDILNNLSDKIENTNHLQKKAILKALFGIYVDEKNEEYIRNNCLILSKETWGSYSEYAIAEILALYSSYLLQQNTKKDYARYYFEKVGGIEVLPKDEHVSIIHKVIKQLENAHHSLNNFYNEEPFAERLSSFINQVPDTILKEYVYVVTLCFVGNRYGTSNSAKSYYNRMIKNYSFKEINKLFELIKEDNYLKYRLDNFRRCQKQFKSFLDLLKNNSIPTTRKVEFNDLIKKYKLL